MAPGEAPRLTDQFLLFLSVVLAGPRFKPPAPAREKPGCSPPSPSPSFPSLSLSFLSQSHLVSLSIQLPARGCWLNCMTESVEWIKSKAAGERPYKENGAKGFGAGILLRAVTEKEPHRSPHSPTPAASALYGSNPGRRLSALLGGLEDDWGLAAPRSRAVN